MFEVLDTNDRPSRTSTILGSCTNYRSPLYRSRILQLNSRWKPLAEIYTIHSFAPLSNLSSFFFKSVLEFFQKMLIFPNFYKICRILLNFEELLPEFRRNLLFQSRCAGMRGPGGSAVPLMAYDRQLVCLLASNFERMPERPLSAMIQRCGALGGEPCCRGRS